MEKEASQTQIQVTKKSTYTSARHFVEVTRALLKQQEKYEIELFNDMTKNKSIAQIQQLGYGLANMTVVSSKRGFYGKTVLTVTKTYHSEKNPLVIAETCKIQVGDDVALFKNNTAIVNGVVSKRVGPKLKITINKELDQDNDYEGVNCNVILKCNEVTFRRYFHALQDIEKSESKLLDFFFQQNPTKTPKNLKQMQYQSKNLNELQIQAVKHGITETVHLLHGPPGTGKTTTVCELIVEAVNRKQKVLACGPSNISVDNIVEGLHGKVKCVRIGNPARMIQNIIENSLDFLITKNSGNWKNELKKLQSARKKMKKGGTKEERRALYRQIKQLRDEIYHLQEQAIQEIVEDTDVICCTNAGAADRVFRRYLPKRIFDLVVIDQCGQSLQVACWIPMLKGRRVVLAGDHKQLPPTIQGNENSLLGYTLFTRAMQELVNITSTMLQIQYRMNKIIMGWSNQQFYQNRLRAHDSVENHTLRGLYANVSQSQDNLLMIDTSGCGMGQEGEINQSKINIGQADIVCNIYKKLLSYQVEAKHIAILTPYSKQVSYIKSLIAKAEIPVPDISTVDGIQGRQKECILISLVRSNSRQDIGFLKDWRRMNVAVTRARRMLVLVGNIDCISVDKYMANLIKWIQQHGNVCSAQDFRGYEGVRFGLGASDKIDRKKNEQKPLAENAEKVKKIKNKKKEKNEENDKNHKQHSEQQQKAMKDHFRKVFEQMLRQITINNASSFERKMIHELAEEMNLCHETSPDKKFIKVWRKLTNEEIAQKYAQQEKIKHQADQIEEERKKRKKQKNKNKNQEKGNSRRVTGPNKYAQDMKNLIGQQSSEEEKEIQEKEEKTEEQTKEEIVEQKKGKKKKKKEKGLMIEQKRNQQQEDIQNLIKEYQASQPKVDECYKCKKKISSVTAAECRFCNANFCRNHVLAEEHGCGEIAKVQARKGMKPSQKILQQATQKLKQKIRQQEQARKRKPKQTKK